jgi:peptidoglycan hydrolase-like protein with peptidoglycan-binding domain
MKKIISLALGLATMAIATVVSAQGITFPTDLSMGQSGQDVTNLQTVLIAKGFDIPAISNGSIPKGYFGGQTKAAVIRFQLSLGLPPTGYVGPMTRSQLNGTVVGPAFRVISPNGGEKFVWGNWIVRWSPGTSTSKVDIFLVKANSSCTTQGGVQVCQPTLNVQIPLKIAATNTGSAEFLVTGQTGRKEVDDGQYYLRICQKSATGADVCDMSDKSFSVSEQEPSVAGELKIVSPNGGDILARGKDNTILWSSPRYIRATFADIKLIPSGAPTCPAGAVCMPSPMISYMIATNVDINQNSYQWKVGKVFYTMAEVNSVRTSEPVLPDGKYSIEICETGTSNCDRTDAEFSIVSSIGGMPDIDVITPNGGETYNAGGYIRSTINVTGDSAKVGNKVLFSLVDSNNAQTLVYTYTSDGLSGSKTVDVPVSYRTAGGSYRLLINLQMGNQPQAYDYSDGAFNLVSWADSCIPGYVCEPLVQ